MFRVSCIISTLLLTYFQRDATLHSSFISGKLLYMCIHVELCNLASPWKYIQRNILTMHGPLNVKFPYTAFLSPSLSKHFRYCNAQRFAVTFTKCSSAANISCGNLRWAVSVLTANGSLIYMQQLKNSRLNNVSTWLSKHCRSPTDLSDHISIEI